jgi:hypothetical protein
MTVIKVNISTHFLSLSLPKPIVLTFSLRRARGPLADKAAEKLLRRLWSS